MYDDEDCSLEGIFYQLRMNMEDQNNLVQKNSDAIKFLRKDLKEFSEATSFLVDNPELCKELGAAARKVKEVRTEAKALSKQHTDFIVKANEVIQNLNFRVASVELSMDKFLTEMKGNKL